jgi:site-specific DNA-methyltransferase (adenine-specific)
MSRHERVIRVEHGDCLEVIPRLVAEGILADAIVTDPPYGLEFMGKEWDSFRGSNTGIKLPKTEGPWARGKGAPVFGPNRRNQKCPRCNKWAYDYPERKCVCGGAGAEGRRIYSTGFQEFTETWACVAYSALKPGGFLLAFGGTRTHHRLWCAIEDAGFVIQDTISWLYGQGFPKNRTLLKPAFEPIVVAYKPGGKRTLQIDECRIPTDWSNDPSKRGLGYGYTKTGSQISSMFAHGSRTEYDLKKGRWPANLCHDGSDEVMAAFAAFGTANHGTWPADKAKFGYSGGERKQTGQRIELLDRGTAARFFYCAKADADDRWGSRHPTVKPVELIKWLVALVCPPQGTVLDPFAGSGTTAVAAMATGREAILIERDDQYIADIRERVAFYEGDGRHSVVSKNRNRDAAVGSLL